VNRFPARIQPDAADRGSHSKYNNVHYSQTHLSPVLSVVSPVEIEPEKSAQPVREPGCEQGRYESEQVVEVGDGLGDNPSNKPQSPRDGSPRAKG
jgi:hypothetical protein